MEKLLIMRNFSFYHSVSKRLVLQTHKDRDIFGKRLKKKNMEESEPLILTINSSTNKPLLYMYKSSENTGGGRRGGRRNCDKQIKQILFFPQHFLPLWRTLHHLRDSQNCRLQTLSVWKHLKFIVLEAIIPFPHNDAF